MTKNYYELLDIVPTASVEEIKRAFRQQIARYHPDKVQHLGQEFLEMGADRAAQLTEAYRILSNPGLREQYDRSRPGGSATPPPSEGASPPRSEEVSPLPSEEVPRPPDDRFSHERASRDEFVKVATLGRLREALTAIVGAFDELPLPGFDLACVVKAKRFSRTKSPRFLARFVPRVDGPAVTDAWAQALKWNVPAQEEVCVLLIGSSVATQRELADAINTQRRKPASRSATITMIPVDMRDWEAHIPFDAPAVVKSLLIRLRSGK